MSKSNQTVFKCLKCEALWTRRTILQDVCPQCGGEITDVTDTRVGQEFLNIIEVPAELRAGPLDQQPIYATGPSSLFSVHARKS